MAKKNRTSTGTKLLLFLLIIGAVMGIGYYFSYSSKSLETWIKEKDTPIVAHLNKAAELFEQKQYAQAEKEFQAAYKLAKIANTESKALWKERMSKIAPPRKFYSGTPADRVSSGSIYFENRMIDAIFGYSSSVYWSVTARYSGQILQAIRDQDPLFKIPQKEFKPALDAIATGLEIEPKSTNFRILKAEILKDCGDYNEAIAILDEVITLIDNSSAEAYNLLGIIYSMPYFMQSTNYEVYREKAISMFEKASVLPSIYGGQLAAPNYNLGLYYSTPPADKPANSLPSKLDAQKAINYFEKYLEVAGQDSEYSQKARDEIAKLQRIAP